MLMHYAQPRLFADEKLGAGDTPKQLDIYQTEPKE